MKLFIFGIGYSGLSIAQAAMTAGIKVSGTVRTEEKAIALCKTGIDTLLFDGMSSSSQVARHIQDATHIIVSIAPGQFGDPVLNALKKDMMSAPNLKWMGYLSTVGVYGDHEGVWVDEKTVVCPVSERSKQRFMVEQAWMQFAQEKACPLAILRLSGIYGLGRSAFDKLRAGTARRIIKPGQVFNRIYVDDIATATMTIATNRANGIINVTDNEPCPPQEVITYAATTFLKCQLPPEIPFDEASLSLMARSFYGENKRVKNDRLINELGVVLTAPTYREGLAHIFARAIPDHVDTGPLQTHCSNVKFKSSTREQAE